MSTLIDTALHDVAAKRRAKRERRAKLLIPFVVFNYTFRALTLLMLWQWFIVSPFQQAPLSFIESMALVVIIAWVSRDEMLLFAYGDDVLDLPLGTTLAKFYVPTIVVLFTGVLLRVSQLSLFGG